MSSKERRLEDDAIPPQSPPIDDRSGQASPKRKEKSSKQAHKGSRPRPVSSVRHSSRKREAEGVLSASDHTPSPPPLSGEEHPSLKGPATASASTTMPPSEVSAEAGKSSALSGSTTAGETPRGTSGTATVVASPPVPEATSPEQGQLLSPQQSRQQRRAHSPSPPADSRGVERTPAKHASTEDTHTAEQPASMSKTLSPLSLLETSDRGAKATAPLSTGEVLIPKSSPSRSEPARALKAAAAKTNQDYACGLFGFHPNFLQKYRTPRCALTVLCLVSFTRSFSMNGVMMVVLPTLERRYQLMSYESGMILSSNDVASCLTMLPVAFLATKRNKPRFIGYGVATMGLGNLVVAMVHFLSPSYQLGAAGTDTCPMANVESSCTMSGSIRNFRFMMMAGQLLSGLGATPINTVTIAYLDENVQKRKSSLYIGIFNSMAIIGPSFGFIVGGYTLSHYVDITTDVSALGLSSKSSAWIGAWWLGFLVAGAMGLTLGLITISLPKYLPGYDAVHAERKADQSAVSLVSMMQSSEFGQRITDLPKAIRRLLSNPPFMLLSFAMSFNQMFAIGITSTLTKFFESQFGMASASIAYLTGPIVLVGGGFGAIIGGALVGRWNLDYAGIMRLCMYNCCISWFGVLAFLFNCPENTYATPEGYVGAPKPTSFDFQCNIACNCTLSYVNPVCAADAVVYLSPCLAGCRRELQLNKMMMYSDCSCVNGTLTHLAGVSTERLLVEGVQATRSRCHVDCPLLFVYLLGIFLALSSAFLNAAPATAATIRCVKPAERSLALGIKTVIARLVGSIPAPVILGGIMDEMCLAWHRPCGSSGNCIAYQNEDMARGMFYALVAMLSMSTLLFYLSLLAHRRRARKREAARSMQALFIGSGIHSIGTPKDTNDVSSPISR